jgi:hypothetical protein
MARLIAVHDECLILAIADDVYIVGPPASAAAAFGDYSTGVSDAGGAVNLTKSLRDFKSHNAPLTGSYPKLGTVIVHVSAYMYREVPNFKRSPTCQAPAQRAWKTMVAWLLRHVYPA